MSHNNNICYDYFKSLGLWMDPLNRQECGTTYVYIQVTTVVASVYFLIGRSRLLSVLYRRKWQREEP